MRLKRMSIRRGVEHSWRIFRGIGISVLSFSVKPLLGGDEYNGERRREAEGGLLEAIVRRESAVNRRQVVLD